MADDNLVIGLALVAVIVSAIGLGFNYYNQQAGITGFAQYNDTGWVNITIEAQLAIRFVTPTYNLIDWQNGTVYTGANNATLDTSSGTVVNGTWVPVTHGFIIENIGNVIANLSIMTDVNASTLLGGNSPNPEFQFNWTNNESGSCLGGTQTEAVWFDVNTTSKGTHLCTEFLTAGATDEVRVDVRLVVPSNSYTGTRTAVVTAIADTDW